MSKILFSFLILILLSNSALAVDYAEPQTTTSGADYTPNDGDTIIFSSNLVGDVR